LLFRFYEAQGGSIEVDGHNVEDITINSLREHIGVVPQDTVLFNETLMYNLRYANPEVSDEMIYDACRAASIHDKILTFSDGYNTRVGERGLRLSGGEKQRVAIARTILKNPKIILLDEATAALDSETEQHIQAALRELAKGRTMLVIAHRLSTIIAADQIICIHEGKVAEAGTHDELIALSGRYKSMWNKQIRAEKVQKAKARLEESHNTPMISSTSSAVSDDSESERAIGATPALEPTEITPATRQAEDLLESLPSGASTPGNAGESSAAGLKRSGSAASIEKGRWSAKGLRKALGKKGGILHKRGRSADA